MTATLECGLAGITHVIVFGWPGQCEVLHPPNQTGLRLQAPQRQGSEAWGAVRLGRGLLWIAPTTLRTPVAEAGAQLTMRIALPAGIKVEFK